MSGFAVYLDFQHPARPGALDAMAVAIAPRGRDRQATHTSGPCAMANAARWTTPEAEQEELPQRHATRNLWLVADARIDNRAELCAQLRGKVRQPLVTDADLILAAYDRWGEECPRWLVGDFGFAVWDGDRQTLLVARDHVGIKPVFFSRQAGGVLVGSTAAAVLAGLAQQPALDEEYLAAYLANVPPPDYSMWTDLKRLPAGHLLQVRSGTVIRQRWWKPSLEPVSQSIEDTVEQVRTTFDEAVRARLRTRDAVSCDLSGGYDSSTITATVAGMGVEPRAVGLAFRANPEADETRYMEAVARHLGTDLHLIEADHLDVIDPLKFAAVHREPLYAVDAADTSAKYDWVSANGGTVSLSGVGGDDALFGEDVAAIDLAASGRLGAAFAMSAHDDLTTLGTLRWLTRSLARDGVRRLADRASHRWPGSPVALGLSQARRRRFRAAHPWLLTYPAMSPRQTLRPPRVSRAAWTRSMYYVDSTSAPIALELTGCLAAERGVEVRYPFLDRRVVELCLRLPESHVRWRGEYRGLHRETFGSRLPTFLIARQDKASLSRPYMRKLLAAVDRDQAVAAIGALGRRVDLSLLMSTYDTGLDAFNRPAGEPRGLPLWAALSAGAAVSVEEGRTRTEGALR